jgi:hypothetical protein
VITHVVHVSVADANAHDFFEYLTEPTDASYRSWWPGVHRRFQIVRRGDRESHVGDVVFMDEQVGSRRLAARWTVVCTERDQLMSWQLTRRVRLPAWLDISLVDHGPDLELTHVIRVGYASRAGRLLDPVLQLMFPPDYRREVTEHAQEEFPRLAAVIRARPNH